MSVKGRSRATSNVLVAKRAAAVGRLMLGELNDWHEFLEAAVVDLGRYSRHEIRAAEASTRKSLSKEIRKFCAENFLT